MAARTSPIRRRAPGPATQCLVYRYREDGPRKRGGRRELLCNTDSIHSVEREVQAGLFGVGRYRLEWRDARFWVARVAAVSVAPPGASPARDRRGARRVPPQPLGTIRAALRPPATPAPIALPPIPPKAAPYAGATAPLPGVAAPVVPAMPRPALSEPIAAATVPRLGPRPAPVAPLQARSPQPPVRVVPWPHETVSAAPHDLLGRILEWWRLAAPDRAAGVGAASAGGPPPRVSGTAAERAQQP